MSLSLSGIWPTKPRLIAEAGGQLRGLSRALCESRRANILSRMTYDFDHDFGPLDTMETPTVEMTAAGSTIVRSTSRRVHDACSTRPEIGRRCVEKHSPPLRIIDSVEVVIVYPSS